MSPPSDLDRTPLFDAHAELGARFGEFAGYEMPIQYAGIMDEHRAVRRRAGLFDVSHMGEIELDGPEASDAVQHLITNDADVDPGRACYTVMCTEEGGIVDDLLVYRLDTARFMLVVNAANTDSDFSWVRSHAEPFDVRIRNRSEEFAQLALQGPRALEVLDDGFRIDASKIGRFGFVRPEDPSLFTDREVYVSRTGYTGEDGVEIYCEADIARAVWNRLIEVGRPHGLEPAGLGARDTLRLEAGLTLYGHEIDADIHPFEAGLGWLVELDSGPFVGREALDRIRDEGWDRQLTGFVLEARGIPRQGYALVDEDDREVGIVTSGTQSPILERGIGLGYVPRGAPYQDEGSPIGVQIRNRTVPARIEHPPLHHVDE